MQGNFGVQYQVQSETMANGKPMEICTTLQMHGWGYVKDDQHLNADHWSVCAPQSARKPIFSSTRGHFHPEPGHCISPVDC